LSGRQADQVLKLYESGTPVPDIAATFKVGRDTVYRVIRAAALEARVGDDVE
jgi:DNA invertase Pin-like site-specific DNA recombinase